LEGKWGCLLAEEHHPNREAQGWQHHVVGVICCRRDWCTSQNTWHHEDSALTWILKKMCGQNWKSVCEQGGLQTWLSYTSSVWRNGPKFTQLIVGSLWKATRNVFHKLNNLKAMLPNTNWVYAVAPSSPHWLC
jgi:hypothetical protein